MSTKQDTIDSAEHQALIQRFVRWDVDRKLTQRGHTSKVPAAVMLRAKQRVTVAIQFLEWLDQRGVDLPDCTQHDLDAWFGSGPTTRWHSTPFINWARKQRILRGITIPPRSIRTSPTIGSDERVQHLREVLLHDQLPMHYRLIGAFVLLFGQSLSRIVTLTRDHVDVNGALRTAGIPVLAARNSTWLQLVREAPPAVLARTLGISPRTAMQHATRAGTDYQAYAAERAREEQN